MPEVVANRPFDYAGTYRYTGEVFALGGHTGDAALLAIGYLREYEPTGDETEDDEGRLFISEQHVDAAREHCAQMLAEREAKAEAKSNVEERFNARDALIIEERAVHGYTWQCPGHPEIGGCGRPIPVAQIVAHIRKHHEPARSRIAAEHEAAHAATRDRSVPVSANIATDAHDGPDGPQP